MVKILVSALMGPGTLEAKVEPLSKIDDVSEILFVRKKSGPPIQKVNYIALPSVGRHRSFHWIVAPVIILSETIKHRPELLISYHILPYAIFVAAVGLITKTPYINCQTGIWIQRQAKHRVMARMLHFIFKRSLQVNCPGSLSVIFWQTLFPDIRDKFRELHSTVDTERFVPDDRIPWVYDFIFLGRIADYKNIDLIIMGFHLLNFSREFEREPELVIVGDGNEKKNLEILVDQLMLKERVHFTGFVQDPLSYLQQSRFLVMASNTEGLPTAMMQAMACEVIPITNLVGNIPDLVSKGETGFTYKDTNAQEIAETMQCALSTDEGKLMKIKKSARDLIIKKHSYEYATSQWVNVLEKINV